MAAFPLLDGLLRRRAGNLSGGEQQAVAIGRALMTNPRLLLLDEVSLGLAPIMVDTLYDSLGTILAGGTTVLLVEQDLGLLTVAVAVALLGGLQLLLARTGLGRAIRATAADADTAELVGIDSRRVYAWAAATATAAATAATAAATAGLAGAFFAMRSSVSPSMGPTQLLFAFEVVVIGGLGSLWGTLAGGMVLGVAQTVGAQVDPRFSIVAGHAVFLAVLAFRPQGLLGMRRSRT